MLNNFTLLLIEPNQTLQESISHTLNANFDIKHIIYAESCQQSQGIIHDCPPINCIIINSQLPDCSGFELINEIKNQAVYSDTPVLLISEKQDRSHLLQAAACGASDFITSPFSEQSLILKLKKLITGQEFRLATRVDTFEAVQLEIDFNKNQAYKARLTDISTGGCSVISELFRDGGCVYDKADIHFKCHEKSFSISAELIRTECNPEALESENKELLAAFEFNHLTDHHKKMLHNFIAGFGEFN